MKRSILTGGFVAAMMLLAGCQNTVNTVENADKNMTPNTIQDARFITDGFLKDRLALKDLVVSQTPDGFMRAQLEVVNVRIGPFAQAWSGLKDDNPYHIRYKFTWYDQAGMAVETVLSDWQDKWILPGETVQFQSVAPSPACRDFRLNLMEGE